MASTSDIRNGFCMEWRHDIFSVVEFQHVKPGKGPAFVRTKLKSLTTGRVLDNTFPSGHKITEVRIERREFQYLYNDSEGYHFMNTENFNQLSFPVEMIDNPGLLKEGEKVDVLYNSDKNEPLIMEMPTSVVVSITYTEPGLKGDTATNTFKPATVETGAEVRVPLFINQGDVIRVDTSNNTYMERVKL